MVQSWYNHLEAIIYSNHQYWLYIKQCIKVATNSSIIFECFNNSNFPVVPSLTTGSCTERKQILNLYYIRTNTPMKTFSKAFTIMNTLVDRPIMWTNLREIRRVVRTARKVCTQSWPGQHSLINKILHIQSGDINGTELI